MSAPTATTRSTADYWNQKMPVIDTGANLALIPETFAGMFAFCTVTGGGFTVDVLYQRNETNTAWGVVIFSNSTGGGAAIKNKTISGASNTITTIPISGLKDGGITEASIADAITVFASAHSSATFSTSSTTYVNVTSVTITATLSGDRSALVTEYITSGGSSAGSTVVCFLAITDGSNTILAETRSHTASNTLFKLNTVAAYEIGPTTAGSTTRKVRAKVDDVSTTYDLNPATLTAGQTFYLWEIL